MNLCLFEGSWYRSQMKFHVGTKLHLGSEMTLDKGLDLCSMINKKQVSIVMVMLWEQCLKGTLEFQVLSEESTRRVGFIDNT